MRANETSFFGMGKVCSYYEPPKTYERGCEKDRRTRTEKEEKKKGSSHLIKFI